MSNNYPELSELVFSFMKECNEEHNLTVKEHQKIYKRMTENDLMYLDMFRVFSKYMDQEVEAVRTNTTPPYKKVVDNLVRGEGFLA